MSDGSFNLFAGGNREVTLLRAKIRQLRIEILGTEYVMRGRGSRIVVMRWLGMETRRVSHQAGNRGPVDVVNGVLPVEIERRRSQDGPIIRALKRLNILQQAVVSDSLLDIWTVLAVGRLCMIE